MQPKHLWILAALVLSAGALAETPSPHINTTPPAYAASTGGLYPIYTPDPGLHWTTNHRNQGCVRLAYTVTAKGTVKNVRVWSSYPAGAFDDAAVKNRGKWRYHPRMVGGHPVATPLVLQTVVFMVNQEGYTGITGTHFKTNSKLMQHTAEASLMWFCEQPPMHGVKIMARQAPASATTPTEENPWANPVVYLASPMPQTQEKGQVKVHFCVGPDGRVRNTVIGDSSPAGVYDAAAREALEEVNFSAREFKDKPVWTCGLTVPITFADGANAGTGEVGKIGLMHYDKLLGSSNAPQVETVEPVQLSLSIPAGTRLPPVAKVELNLCIEPNGRVSRATVVQADPKDLFNRAAIKTVSGWRYEKLDARMCDVYEWVKFPLSGG